MEEWLCHHLAIGVDHFFLYDNGSTDDLHDVLKPYADHGIVTTVYFPMRGLQRDANNHVVRFFGSTTEWLAYVDIDEFLVPEHDEPHRQRPGPLPRRRAGARLAQGVLLRGPPHAARRPRHGGLPRVQRGRAARGHLGDPGQAHHPARRPRCAWASTTPRPLHGRTVNTAGQPTSEEATVIEDPSYANLQMNHYYTKSWQEFQAKRNRATTSTHCLPAAGRALRHPGPGRPRHRPLAAAHEGAHRGDATRCRAAPRATAAGCA